MSSSIRLSLVFHLLAFVAAAGAAPSVVEQVSEGVFLVRDDGGVWGGDWSKSVTHMNEARYQARKILDMSQVSPETWAACKAIRLRVCLMVRDYSWHDRPPANGLDEAIEIMVNGKVHSFLTKDIQPAWNEKAANSPDWWEMPIPKDELQRGVNEIVLRKAPSDKNDDYLYLGIDNSEGRGNSSVTFDGLAWRSDMLTIPGGQGEYLVRLYLILREPRIQVRWRPATNPSLEDPAKLVLYAGARQGRLSPEGLLLTPGQFASIEWHPQALDILEPVLASAEVSGTFQLAWLDKGKAAEARTGSSPLSLSLPAQRHLEPSGLVVMAKEEPVTLRAVTLDAGIACQPPPEPIDLCPVIHPPAGSPSSRKPRCQARGTTFELANSSLRCRFEAGDGLRLVSLFNEHTATEMVRHPESVWFFLVEIGERRFAGSRDFVCTDLRVEKRGFVAELVLRPSTEDSPLIPPLSLCASLSTSVDEEGLHLALTLSNAGESPADFKLAFPHLAGLAVSEKPEEDYYFYPAGGGIIASVPTLIRMVYGDHQALYQVMDIFSASRGGGISIRADDPDGWHKTLAFRKYTPNKGDQKWQRVHTRTAEEFQWKNPLETVEGCGFAYEYLRRTRKPRESFTPAPAVIAAHPGDWRVAMRQYADWAHRVWKFRPFPSRLKDVYNMIARGWSNDFLFKDGHYRTDALEAPIPGVGRTRTDCIELMSWWEWSPLGPWSTPFDKLPEKLPPGVIDRWKPYFVIDPVTGQTMWNNQPGDYDGYNVRFGGLPAFRKFVQSLKDAGAMVTLYTDPFRLDDASKTGQQRGKQWGVVGHDGKHTTAYEVWNPCHDNPDVRRWVAQTMERVMLETGADGLRLDEYGHLGWACFSDLHAHSFAERGVSQWQKATADATRQVREAMNRVRLDLVLTTEHPGYDYLMQFLDGCITYDLTVLASTLRPLECNLQRFYFPECKAYELDHHSVDPDNKKRFWNAVGAFGRYYPPAMYMILRENMDAYLSRDCEPLIFTLTKYVYANRFSAGEKEIYHLFNAKGHTFEGSVLRLPLSEDEHLFDLLSGREATFERAGKESVLNIHLPNREVACVAKLIRRLSVERHADELQVRVKGPGRRHRLAVCDAEGEHLFSQAVKGRINLLSFSQSYSSAKPASVKLLEDDTLADITEIPDEDHSR